MRQPSDLGDGQRPEVPCAASVQLVQRGLGRAAAAAFTHGNEFPTTHVELLFLVDLPLVVTRLAQCLAARA